MKFELNIQELPTGGIVNLVRQLNGITKVGLCESAGISVPTLKSVIKGNEVNLDTVFSLFKVLGIEISYSENGEPVPDLGDPFDYAVVLRKLRSAKEISQNTLAGMAECQPLTISNIESASGARWSNYLKALEVLGVELLITYKFKKDVQKN